MVCCTYMRVKDQKVNVTFSIYSLEAYNKDQALLMDIRKKDISIIMTFMSQL